MRYDVITLIGEAPKAHGVFEQPNTTERTVFCTVRSVGMRETYEALAHDLRPEVVFELADYAEYQDEKTCRWNGKTYRILRTYVKGQKIELTVQKE